jgi:RND family efflux transporter MFP subunit
MKSTFLIHAVLVGTLLLGGTALHASPGHDHGEEAAAASPGASPRIAVHSDDFEAVGVVDNGAMTVYLDHYSTNEPVTGVRIEVAAGLAQGIAAPQPDGTYRFEDAALKESGTLPVSFRITAGQQSAVLTGELPLGGSHDHDDEEGHGDDGHGRATQPWLKWAAGGGATLLLAVVFFVALRRRRARVVGGAMAALLAVVAATGPEPALAGAGHDHGEAAPTISSNAPRRQADGSVFLPKASQRQLVLRTVRVEEKALPKTLELTGRVIADANAGGKVQPTQAGRIEAGPRGLPQLGQAVRKGETLALVRTSASPMERANQVAQTAELRASAELARKRVARLAQLEGTVAQKDMDAAQAEADSLAQRLAAVSASVSSTEALVAPVSGVIAATNVVAGQVVDAREVLFEIVDPSRLVVEASAFDAGLPANIAAASASAAPGSRTPLRFTGAGRVLREGALPLHFATVPGKDSAPLAVNQPVKVIVQTRETVTGFAVPAAAVVKNAGNQDIVWVHTQAEVFVARAVRSVPLDGATVSVVDGLEPGDRVVTQGAPLLNQVR